MKKIKKVYIALTAVMVILSILVASAFARANFKVHPQASTPKYTEPHWSMSGLSTSTHYTNKSGQTWYPIGAFYLPQFLTGVKNTDGASTYYCTSMNGGKTFFPKRNDNYVNDILTPDKPPEAGFDYYYQFRGAVTNSDPQYSNVWYNSGKFYVDANAPSVDFNSIGSGPISVTIRAYDTGSGDKATSDETFDNDNGSGLKNYKYRVSSNGGSSWGAWSGNKTADYTTAFSSPGKYQIEVLAYDNVGNHVDRLSNIYVIQKATPPHVTVSGSYHTDTDVITSVVVTAGSEVNPEQPGTVTFTIPGITSQSKSYVLPAGGSEPVWFRWHTPSTEQELTGSVTITSPGGSQTITPTFDVEELDELTPPDPKGTDKPDPYFQYISPPLLETKTSASWNQYTAEQKTRQVQVWNAETQKYDTETQAYWEFTNHAYSATLSATLKAAPDSHNPTATQSYGVWTMKSGYGITENVTTSVSTNDSSAVIGVQHVIGYYPESMYNDTGYDFGGYDRVFETLSSGLNAAFNLKANKYSMYNSHVHFTSVWWADNKPYQPITLSLDAYCPGGALSVESTDTINIQGACYNDWYIKPSP